MRNLDMLDGATSDNAPPLGRAFAPHAVLHHVGVVRRVQCCLAVCQHCTFGERRPHHGRPSNAVRPDGVHHGIQDLVFPKPGPCAGHESAPLASAAVEPAFTSSSTGNTTESPAMRDKWHCKVL